MPKLKQAVSDPAKLQTEAASDPTELTGRELNSVSGGGTGQLSPDSIPTYGTQRRKPSSKELK